MSEWRRDPTTNAWVIIASERGRRPNNGAHAPKSIGGAACFDPACPFCPGNELMLPSIISETASAETPGWRTRVVENKFPALSSDAVARHVRGPLFEVEAGRGHHEVIVESPRHDSDLTTMSQNEVRGVLAAYRNRYDALMANPSVRATILFRNRGRRAGASLQHPHSQAIALERTPPFVRARHRAMLDYYRDYGSCALCDVIVKERLDASRVVRENEAFVTFVPFAASAPFEMWLAPKRHQADFGDILDPEIAFLALALQDALTRLEVLFSDASYNHVIDTAPKGGSRSPFLHWLLRIVPQSTAPGGFELASGVKINPSLPERDAAALRQVGSAESRNA